MCFFSIVSGKILGVLSSFEIKDIEYHNQKSIIDNLSDNINASLNLRVKLIDNLEKEEIEDND